jgi:hypothetical protein
MKHILDVPDLDEVSSLTDWFELAFLVSGATSKTHAQLRDTLTAAVAASAEEVELAGNLVFKEVKRRRHICGSRYPFVVEEKTVLYDGDADGEFYKFLLLVVVSPLLRNEKRHDEVDQLFDDLVLDAIKGYLGEGSTAVRFGWPASGGRPKKFETAIAWLTAQMNLQPGVGATLPQSKDGGVDVVAWKPFNDRKAAYVVILAQCTIRTNWLPKAKDIIDMVWLAWLDTGRPVVIALAIPFIIPPQFDRWDMLRRTAGVVFDRLRICQYLATSSSTNHAAMVTWANSEMSKLTA